MQKELDKKKFEAKVFPSWYDHMICHFSQWFYYDYISDVVLFCEKLLDKHTNKEEVLSFLCVDTLVCV